MTDNRATVPIEYFLLASDHSLQNFALIRLNQAANLRKEIKAMEDEMHALLEAAGVAQWLLENREALKKKTGIHVEEGAKVA